jgi:hypothetical protein
VEIQVGTTEIGFAGFYRQIVWWRRFHRGIIKEIHAGDVLDFWRVLYANKEGKLVLFAEMKLPGETWLEFKIINNVLYQSATFKPHGLWGNCYWYSVLPFHGFLFRMLQRLIN